jgi:hypothetical protein
MEQLSVEVAEALRNVRALRQWKPGRDVAHLRKRQRRGHLPAEADMETYNQLIQNLVHTLDSLTYCYPVGEHRYYAVRGKVEQREWLIIFDAQGILETAFPPTDIEGYLNRQGFEYVGTVGEILL